MAEKSGATYRREKKPRMEDDKRLGSLMDGFLQRQSCEELFYDDAHGSGLDSIAHTTCAGNETRNSTNAGGTTADIAHQEQLSLCVRIVHSTGCVSEHILACQRALETTAVDLFSIILTSTARMFLLGS